MNNTPTSLKIAISFVEDNTSLEQIWYGSGLLQNLKFYYDLFEIMGHDVYFMVQNAYSVSHKGNTYKTVEIQDTIDNKEFFDIIIEAGSVITLDQKAALKTNCGAHIVGLRCGNQLFIIKENLLTSKNLKVGQITAGQDYMWLLPHHAKQKSFIEVLHSSPTTQIPYIWESDFISKKFQNAPLPKPVDIKVMEPNISVLKNSIIPFAIVEYLYRSYPDSFDKATFYNTEDFASEESFLMNFVQHFTVLQDSANRSYFGNRQVFDTVFNRPDILLGYQHENDLNNLYKEALFSGVPLVHNAPAYAEVGYYYPDCQVEAGAEQILNVISNHNSKEYLKRNDNFLYGYSIHNPAIQKEYQNLIDQVLDTGRI